MKFACEKALLQSAIAVTSRAVAQKSSIPALEGLLLHADSRLTISGYNLQTGIRTKVSTDVTEPGEIVLNARLFGDIIRRMPDDVVVFTADDKQLVHLSCGDADFDILGLSAADYPDLPEVEDEFSVSIQQKRLRAMIEETAFAVSTNESRPIHTGALFEITDQGLTMVAVDGFRLALRREPLERIDGGAFRFVAPGSALNEVEKICADTGCKIDIEDDGSIFIASEDIEACRAARQTIENIVFEPEVGELYYGKVSNIRSEFGAWVELAPGKDGLVKIKDLEFKRTEKVEDVLKIGDMTWVKVMNVDDRGRIDLSRKDAMREKGLM